MGLNKVSLQHGADVNRANLAGETPLHIAASLGHIRNVSYLAQHGAALNQTTLEGDTALHRAAAMV